MRGVFQEGDYCSYMYIQYNVTHLCNIQYNITPLHLLYVPVISYICHAHCGYNTFGQIEYLIINS